MMDAKDVERLIKLLGMTESESDGEALNALRMTQKLLKRYNVHLVDYVKFADQEAKKMQQSQVRTYQPSQTAYSDFGGIRNFDANLYEQMRAQQNACARHMQAMQDRENKKRSWVRRDK